MARNSTIYLRHTANTKCIHTFVRYDIKFIVVVVRNLVRTNICICSVAAADDNGTTKAAIIIRMAYVLYFAIISML